MEEAMKKIMNIEQLADEANAFLSQNQISGQDKRYSTEVSARRIRDYISKGLLDKPFKEGKNIFFNENHLEKLIALRQFQSDGLSEQYLHKLIKSQSEDSLADNEQVITPTSYTDTFSLSANGASGQNLTSFNASLANIGGSINSESTESMSVNFSQTDMDLQQKAQKALSRLSSTGTLHSSTSVQSFYNKQPDKKGDLNALNYPVNKIWQEYPLDEEGKVFLRIEQGNKIKNKDKVLENIINLLNILGDKND
jgi:DNA-binding transcriptional MerR regulator